MGEIYTALQAGVLDGMGAQPADHRSAGKYYETAKFFSLTQHIFSALAAYLSNATFNRMDAKLKEGFLASAKAAAAIRAPTPWARGEEGGNGSPDLERRDRHRLRPGGGRRLPQACRRARAKTS